MVDSRRFKVTGDVHLLLLDGDKILFGRRQNTGFEDGAYHVPSGHLESGESVIAAVIREAKGEIGVTIAPGAIEFAHVMHTRPVVAALPSSSPYASGKAHSKTVNQTNAANSAGSRSVRYLTT